MNVCNHAGWFRASGSEYTHLHHSSRMATITREMENPHSQYPSTIFFVGRMAKDTAMRQIFPNSNIRRGRSDSLVDLRSDSATIQSDFPILFADGDLSNTARKTFEDASCHEDVTYPIDWKAPASYNVNQVLFARLVCLFSDVVCVFVEDFPNVQTCVQFLMAWIDLGRSSDLPFALKPRLVIVAKEGEGSVTHSVLETDELQSAFKSTDELLRRETFSSVSLLQVTGDQISPLARHRRLKEVLLSELDTSRDLRVDHRMLFSAKHLSALVRPATEHVARSFTSPFRFLQAMRAKDPIEEDYRHHLRTFFDLAKKHRVLYNALTDFVASTLVMDAYPPQMHGEF